MSLSFWIATACTAGLVGALLVAEVRDIVWLRWVSKPLASVGFLAAALSAGWPEALWAKGLFGALVLSLLGDVLLLPAASGRAFLAGLGSFLGAHLLFGAAFLVRGVSPGAAAAGALVAGGGAVAVWRWLGPHVRGRMRGPVRAYIIAIVAMVSLAVGTFPVGPSRQGGALALGAVAFFVSDLAVARNRFVAPGASNRLWGLPLYYGAQLLFAAAVACGA